VIKFCLKVGLLSRHSVERFGTTLQSHSSQYIRCQWWFVLQRDRAKRLPCHVTFCLHSAGDVRVNWKSTDTLLNAQFLPTTYISTPETRALGRLCLCAHSRAVWTVLSHWSREDQPLSLRKRKLGPADQHTIQKKWQVHWLVASAKKVQVAQLFYLMVRVSERALLLWKVPRLRPLVCVVRVLCRWGWCRALMEW